jgi:hypothetical protein
MHAGSPTFSLWQVGKQGGALYHPRVAPPPHPQLLFFAWPLVLPFVVVAGAAVAAAAIATAALVVVHQL